MTQAEVSLLDFMTLLSRRHFRNDWENGLEFILWHWMRDRCDSPLSPMEKFTLYNRYNRASGWFTSVNGEPHYVRREVWKIAYEREFAEGDH